MPRSGRSIRNGLDDRWRPRPPRCWRYSEIAIVGHVWVARPWAANNVYLISKKIKHHAARAGWAVQQDPGPARSKKAAGQRVDSRNDYLTVRGPALRRLLPRAGDARLGPSRERPGRRARVLKLRTSVPGCPERLARFVDPSVVAVWRASTRLKGALGANGTVAPV
jgi:hypothetical protein